MGKDDRGATSVIGTLMLVAITVVVAAVAGVYVFGVAEQTQDVPPQGAFEFAYNRSADTASFMPDDSSRGSDNLTVTYTHGDAIPSERINVTVSGAKEIGPHGSVIGTDLVFEPNFAGGGNLFSDTKTVTAGDGYTISDVDFVARDGDGNLGDRRKLDLSEATIRVYWVDDDGDTGAVIATWRGPDQ